RQADGPADGRHLHHRGVAGHLDLFPLGHRARIPAADPRRRPVGGRAMAKSKQQLPDDEDSELDEEYERIREQLPSHVSDIAWHHGVLVGLLSLVVLEVAVMRRRSDYVLSVEKPSASSLKAVTGRTRPDLDDFIRHRKRSAEGFVRHMTEELREAEAGPHGKP